MARYKIKRHIRQRITLVIFLVILFIVIFAISKFNKADEKDKKSETTSSLTSQSASTNSNSTSSITNVSASASASASAEVKEEVDENDILNTLTEAEKTRINKSLGYIYNNTYDKTSITPEQAYFITCMYYQMYGFEKEMKLVPDNIKEKILSEEIYQNLCYTENYPDVKYISAKVFTDMLSKMFDSSVIKTSDVSKYYFKDIDGYILPLNISGEYMILYKVTKVVKNEDGTFTIRMDGFDTKQVRDMYESESGNAFLTNSDTTESYKDGSFFEVTCVKNASNYYVFKSFK